jgi:hypothetical protein
VNTLPKVPKIDDEDIKKLIKSYPVTGEQYKVTPDIQKFTAEYRQKK